MRHHHRAWGVAATLLLSLLLTPSAQGQNTPTAFRDEFLEHFERSSRKVVMLAEAMPATLYDWSPGEGVMSVGRVYMHIARYNYLYPATSLDVPAPPDIDMDHMEEVTDKETVLEQLRRSVEHVRVIAGDMQSDALTRTTRLYGREVAAWAVLFQLIAHMNEHVGQSVAYARMNGIVPPWSR